MTTAHEPILDYRSATGRLRGPALIASQTWALTIDAYRQLQSRKLFWITLILSTLVAASFGAVGVNAEGLKILWFDEFGGEIFSTKVISPAAFYKLIFLNFGIGIWLAWAAIILALVSTAGMIPELISDGSIDLYLSKPLGRVRLLLTKYMLGLMFVGLQTICFCVAAFLVIGIRGGAWLPGVFWAVPLVTLVYSYLFSIAVLLGLLTGSTVAAILGTLLIWMAAIFAVDQADWNILEAIHFRELQAQSAEQTIAFNERLLKRYESLSDEEKASHAGYQTALGGINSARAEVAEIESSLASWRNIHWWVLAIKAPLPKTSETTSVIQRKLVDAVEFQPMQDEFEDIVSEQAAEQAQRRERDAERARTEAKNSLAATFTAEQHYVNRSAWWSIGTSLGFEAVLLAIACWVFTRRDF